MARFEQVLTITVSLSGDDFDYTPGDAHADERAAFQKDVRAQALLIEATLHTLGFDAQPSKHFKCELGLPRLEVTTPAEVAALAAFRKEEIRRDAARFEELDTVAKERGIVRAIYSLRADLFEIAIVGPVTFRYSGGFGVAWVGAPVESPTYLDAWLQADIAVAMSGDRHHCFFEGFNFKDEGGVRYADLCFGS